MSRILAALGALLLLVSLGTGPSLSSAQQRPASPQKSGEIHGTVSLCGGGSVEGTLVYIPGRNFQAMLAANGAFILNYVPVGTYTLVVHMPNRPLQSVNGVVVSDNTVTTIPPVILCRDDDGDGFTEATDCNDNNPNVHPGAADVCDGLDNDCDGAADEGCPTCTDADQDGYSAQSGCGQAVDCDDANATVHPNAAEACDLIDNNCNATVDEGFDLQTDASNCGACGNACSIPNATASCAQGDCHLSACAPGYLDCDGSASNGCEVPAGLLASDDLNCGACGIACGAGTHCAAGTCVCDASSCANGICVNNQCVPFGPGCNALCEDGNYCNGAETCGTAIPGGALMCQAGTPVNCDDGNVCTDDSCDAASSGCIHTPTVNPPQPLETSCTDAIDNDCDGLTDRADPDCFCPAGQYFCAATNTCMAGCEACLGAGLACASTGTCVANCATSCQGLNNCTETNMCVGSCSACGVASHTCSATSSRICVPMCTVALCPPGPNQSCS